MSQNRGEQMSQNKGEQMSQEQKYYNLQMGGGDIWSILSPKVHLILFIPEKKTGVLGIWEVGEGGGVPYSQK